MSWREQIIEVLGKERLTRKELAHKLGTSPTGLGSIIPKMVMGGEIEEIEETGTEINNRKLRIKDRKWKTANIDGNIK